MSLDYETKNIKNYKDLWVPSTEGRVKLNQLTEVLIFSTMTIGMGSITEDNWKEFYSRCVILETGCYKNQIPVDTLEPVWKWEIVSPEDIYRHIGLVTNAPKMTKAQFAKHAYECRRDELYYKAERYVKKYVDEEVA
tara:strand:- start:1399 stop:1809 length:411 start_codon:yes stop_codon:yes gene_type:complete